ncbi:hypothetical protein BH20ACT7_BH20ACT7_09530 [soil metagenome]
MTDHVNVWWRPNRCARAVRTLVAAAVVLVAVEPVAGGAAEVTEAAAGISSYVDCGGEATGRGTATAPWNSLADVNRRSFGPGDRILLRRGTRCAGRLLPRGSGAAGAPIVIDAYGTGPRPVIAAGGRRSAVTLRNQHHVEIRNLETVGGNPYGIRIRGNAATTLRHFRISNVYSHGVGGVAATKSSGLIHVAAEWGGPTVIDDVVIDGAVAKDTDQWGGIHVSCAGGVKPAGNAGDIVIRNSTAAFTGGDGITIYACDNGLIEHSVAHDVGRAATTQAGTPNAIWTWACRNCTVQHNEGYNVSSPGRDGGVYDIDWGNTNNTVQYNYGHDADGYCVAIFGAEGLTTVNSVVRYNVCENNGQDASLAFQGDVYLATWRGGRIDGVKIYNNTFVWSPVRNEPVLRNRGTTLSGSRPRVFANNIVHSSVRKLVSTDATLSLNHNLYWSTADRAPSWGYGGATWSTFAGYRDGSRQDADGRFAQPRLSEQLRADGGPGRAVTLPGSPAHDAGRVISGMGGRDVFGNAVPQGKAPDIGAYEAPATSDR